ncbi:THAP domain-containing protein 10-like [Ylistrum balloti]|uniref:THAP domain-containing protein 10-like n=1 Tax=Ylistrum balloti TaxID=509963 RepID=UPI0029058065|nr:THAP domain-containing protein 10-like [Ylistrum balloti]
MASSRHKGRRCVVAGCSNTAGDGVSVHTFPSDSRTRNAWKRFVKLTRADWEEPSRHSAICSAHFTPSCFDAQYDLKASLGFRTKRRLNPGSVPSIYPKRDHDHLNEVFFLSSPEKKPREAYAKRESFRVLSELITAETVQSVTASTDVAEPDFHTFSSVADNVAQTDKAECLLPQQDR